MLGPGNIGATVAQTLLDPPIRMRACWDAR